jgi:hypothetical protein
LPRAKANQFNGKTEVEPAALMREFGIVLPDALGVAFSLEGLFIELRAIA